MGTCHHCHYSLGDRVLTWHYPEETYSLSALLCPACAHVVLLRHARGLLIVSEEVPLSDWTKRALGRARTAVEASDV